MRIWHVDHVIPVSAWDLTNQEHRSAFYHWTNLQPLEAKANLKKGGTNTVSAGYYKPHIEERLLVLRALEAL